MKTVALPLRAKGNEVLAVSPDRPVFEALAVMAEKNVGALLVVEGDRLVGVFSERDYARKVILKGKSSKEIPVREIMSSRRLSQVDGRNTCPDVGAGPEEFFAEGGATSVRELGKGSRIRDKMNAEERAVVARERG